MRSMRDQQEDAELQIGSDVRNILNGKDVRERERIDQGPTVYPASQPEAGRRTRPSNYDVPAPKKPKRGLAYIAVTYAFILIFLSLIGYMIYFNVKKKDAVLNSPYNKRQNSAADFVTRGAITSADGEILAETRTNEDGTETRIYPQGNVYAHVIGFDSHGKSGLESKANYELLSSHANIVDQIINGFAEKKNPGDTVVTTLNHRLQTTSYNALGDFRGAIVAMDPKTGAILAMVSKPDFDPNAIAASYDEIVADSSNSQLVNRATQGLYAPGSTFKLITALSYFQKYGTIDGFHYNCTGMLPVGETVVHCYGNASHGEEDLMSAFAHSCNTAFGTIGMDVGAPKLIKTADQMLFGSKLPSPVATSKSRWTLTESAQDAEIVQTAFGQGQTLTNPYHMALVVSAIANDGVLMEPYLISSVDNSAGTEISKETPKKYKKLMSLEEANTLQTLMKEVVEHGTASQLSGRDYQVYGKTGSADYVQAGGSIGTHSWFVGYGNRDGDELVVTVIAEDGGAGSTTAVPMASAVLDAYYQN